MYVPKHFALDDEEVLRFIGANGFGILVSGLEAVHLPLSISAEAPLTLVGHVARANGIWRALDGEGEQLAIFHGPHAYVSPRLYATTLKVPTWNYVAVHAVGRARVVSEPARVVSLLRELTAVYDPELEFTDEYLESRIGGIVAFEMVVERLEGKVKVSQNRPEEDQRRVRASMVREGNPLVEWMEEK